MSSHARQVYPRDLDAERAVLGAILHEPSAVSVVQQLPEDHFSVDSHRLVLAACKSLLHQSKTVDLCTVVAEMRQLGTLAKAGGPPAVSSLVDYLGVARNIKAYMQRIHEAAVDRKLAFAAARVQQVLLNGRDPDAIKQFFDEVDELRMQRQDQGAEFETLDLTAPLPSVSFLIEKLLPNRGILLLVGPPEAGKSILALNMALSIAADIPILEHFELGDTRGGVLIIDEEGDRGLTQERLQKLAAAIGFDLANLAPRVTVAVQNNFRFDDSRSLTFLDQKCTTQKPSLIVADSMVALHTSDEDNAIAVRKLFGVLKVFQRKHSCAFLLIHHVRKLGQNDPRNWVQAVRGSGDWVAAVDSLIGLFQKKSGQRMLLHGKSRYGPRLSRIDIHYEFGENSIELRCDDPASSDPQDSISSSGNQRDSKRLGRKRMLWKYVQEPGNEGVLIKDLVTHFAGQMSRSTVWDLAKELERNGFMSRRSRAGHPTRVHAIDKEKVSSE